MMTTGGDANARAHRQRILAEGETVKALIPYLSALRLVRAELLAQEIQGERAATAVDVAIDGLLDHYYASVQGMYCPSRAENGMGD